MKKNSLMLLFAMLAICGCSKDDDDDKAGGNPAGSQKAFSLLRDGVLFETDSVYAFFHIDNDMHLRFVDISGYIGEEYFAVSLLDTNLTEYIDFVNTPSGWGGAILSYENYPADIYYSDDDAELTYTAQDTVLNKISGVFSGMLIDQLTQDSFPVTNGRFTDIIYEFESSN